jgi:hypothetical protein
MGRKGAQSQGLRTGSSTSSTLPVATRAWPQASDQPRLQRIRLEVAEGEATGLVGGLRGEVQIISPLDDRHDSTATGLPYNLRRSSFVREVVQAWS